MEGSNETSIDRRFTVHVVLQRLQMFSQSNKHLQLQNIAYYIDVLYANIQNNILLMGCYKMNVDGY